MRAVKPLLLVVGLLLAATAAANAHSSVRGRGPIFRTILLGSEEVRTPPVQTDARGSAIVRVDPRGHKMEVTVFVTRIAQITAAHLHLAPRGQNGGVVVDLYGPAPAGPAEQGVLAIRTITRGDLKGPLAGMELSELLAAMEAGNIYVNVHTTAFPGGEIRGQLAQTRR